MSNLMRWILLLALALALLEAAFRLRGETLGTLLRRQGHRVDARWGHDEIRRGLASESDSSRLEALRHLTASGSPVAAFMPEVAPLVRSPSPAVLVGALAAIEQAGASARTVVPDLVRLAAHADGRVRSATLVALSRVVPDPLSILPEGRDLLAGVSHDWGVPVVKEAPRYERQLGLSVVKRGLFHPEMSVRQVARSTAREMGDSAAPIVRSLAPRLSVTNPVEARWDAVEDLLCIGTGGGETVPLLEGALGDPDRTIRLRAAAALVLVDPARQGPVRLKLVWDAIEGWLGGQEFSGRRHARGQNAFVVEDDQLVLELFEAVAAMGKQAREVVPRLVEIVRNPPMRSYAQRLAIETLGSLGTAAAPAVDALTEALERVPANGPTRAAILQAFGKLGPIAAAALPRLNAIARADRGWDGELARRAISRVGSSPSPASP